MLRDKADPTARAAFFYLNRTEFFERNDPAAMGNASARESCPCTRNRNGNVLFGAGFDDLAELYEIGGQEDLFGLPTIAGGILEIGGSAFRQRTSHSKIMQRRDQKKLALCRASPRKKQRHRNGERDA